MKQTLSFETIMTLNHLSIQQYTTYSKLTFDLESGVRVTCELGYLLCQISVFLGIDSGPMYATDRQTDRQRRIIA